MKGDFSRSSFKPGKHFSGVRMQQGRVQLDSDWNESVDIQNHRVERETLDTIGLSGAPLADGGFRIDTIGGESDFTISPGRIYVNGLLCENEKELHFLTQPDYPDLSWKWDQVTYIVYLDVWERHITLLEDPEIREVALLGPDTTTRTKTLWQVKLLPITSKNEVLCGTKLGEWDALIAPPAGKIQARSKPQEENSDLCEMPARAGYRSPENQLYRVEIHQGGSLDATTFKWSRDNGAIATRLESIAGDAITISGLGREIQKQFKPTQWIELSDENLVLHGKPGFLVQIKDVIGNVLTVNWQEDGQLTREDFEAMPTVRLWDSPGAITVMIPKNEDGTKINEGYIPFSDDGVEIRFEEGDYRSGDYWTIPARTATGNIEWPRDDTQQPLACSPHGVRHHYSRLAVLKCDNENLTIESDCRRIFPALTELTQMFYVDGDGQEAMPGEHLRKPLQVGVTNGRWPVDGAKVLFKIVDPIVPEQVDPEVDINEIYGFLTADGKTERDVVAVTVDGIAQCDWKIAEEMQEDSLDTVSQQVEALLLGTDGEPTGLPVRFNANLSIAKEVAYEAAPAPGAPNTRTVQKALHQLRQNVSMDSIGGDGQEAMPGESLPAPLQVRVANNNWPVENAWVHFKIVSSAPGKLSFSVSAERLHQVGDGEILILTDKNGVAQCEWRLAAEAPGTLPQRVVATLAKKITVNGTEFKYPIQPTWFKKVSVFFNANLSIASQVDYNPSDFPGDPSPDNVQDALDQLRENYSLQYLDGDGQEAKPGARLRNPLQVAVANGRWPVDDAQVRFTVDFGEGAPHGLLDSGGGPQATLKVTTKNGLAECFWYLAEEIEEDGEFENTLTQQAEACLVDDEGNDFGLPVRFTASLSVAKEVAYQPRVMPWEVVEEDQPSTVKKALDQLRANVSLETIGGDGQEAKPGEKLRQPIQVRVANNGWPLKGAHVQFEIITPPPPSGRPGKIAAVDADFTAQGDSKIVIATDENGLAECAWQLAEESSETLAQRVKTTLLNDPDHPLPIETDITFHTLPVFFNASLSIAREVSYDAEAGLDNWSDPNAPVKAVHLWSRSFGGTSQDLGYAVAMENGGNVVITGIFNGTVDFGGELFTSEGEQDIYVVKLDAGGNHLWSLSFGGVSRDYGVNVAVDGDGNVVVTGYFQDTVDFGGGPHVSSGGLDIFVVKLDSTGQHLWSRSYGGGGTQSDYGRGVAMDGNGNVVLTGSFQDTVNFGGESLTSAGERDIFVVKLDANGDHLWSHSYGGITGDIGHGLAVDGDGNVVLTGYFYGTVNFGGEPLTSSNGTGDIFVVKLDASGDHLWSRSYGGTAFTYIYDVAMDGTGRVVFTGFFQDTIDFGGGPLTNAGGRDIFMVKLDSNGDHLWSLAYGGIAEDAGKGVVVDNTGNVVVTGFFHDTVDFGGGPLTSAGELDIFVAKLDANGNHLWSNTYGGIAGDISNGVAVDGTGNVVVIGYFQGTVNFGGEPLTSSVLNDIFVVKFGTEKEHPDLPQTVQDAIDFLAGRSSGGEGGGFPSIFMNLAESIALTDDVQRRAALLTVPVEGENSLLHGTAGLFMNAMRFIITVLLEVFDVGEVGAVTRNIILGDSGSINLRSFLYPEGPPKLVDHIEGRVKNIKSQIQTWGQIIVFHTMAEVVGKQMVRESGANSDPVLEFTARFDDFYGKFNDRTTWNGMAARHILLEKFYRPLAGSTNFDHPAATRFRGLILEFFTKLWKRFSQELMIDTPPSFKMPTGIDSAWLTKVRKTIPVIKEALDGKGLVWAHPGITSGEIFVQPDIDEGKGATWIFSADSLSRIRNKDVLDSMDELNLNEGRPCPLPDLIITPVTGWKFAEARINQKNLVLLLRTTLEDKYVAITISTEYLNIKPAGTYQISVNFDGPEPVLSLINPENTDIKVENIHFSAEGFSGKKVNRALLVKGDISAPPLVFISAEITTVSSTTQPAQVEIVSEVINLESKHSINLGSLKGIDWRTDIHTATITKSNGETIAIILVQTNNAIYIGHGLPNVDKTLIPPWWNGDKVHWGGRFEFPLEIQVIAIEADQIILNRITPTYNWAALPVMTFFPDFWGDNAGKYQGLMETVAPSDPFLFDKKLSFPGLPFQEGSIYDIKTENTGAWISVKASTPKWFQIFSFPPEFDQTPIKKLALGSSISTGQIALHIVEKTNEYSKLLVIFNSYQHLEFNITEIPTP